jgi:hypothetical protein
MFGSQIIMTDDILERILDLAHFGKFVDLVMFQGQVSWRYCDRWGAQVFNIVKLHFPPQVPPVTTPQESLCDQSKISLDRLWNIDPPLHWAVLELPKWLRLPAPSLAQGAGLDADCVVAPPTSVTSLSLTHPSKD